MDINGWYYRFTVYKTIKNTKKVNITIDWRDNDQPVMENHNLMDNPRQIHNIDDTGVPLDHSH